MRDKELASISRKLSEALEQIDFGRVHVYNPLSYAWPLHEAYLKKFGSGRKKVLVIGMNPGTGVPFGAVPYVRDRLGITGSVGRPAKEHHKRPIEGLACGRKEVSGSRLWPWLELRMGGVGALSRGAFVHSYCPLAFLAPSGRNVTPNQLPAALKRLLLPPCDRSLREVAALLRPELVLAVGKFAEAAAQRALGAGDGRASAGARIVRILHPSPANPAANRGWAEAAEAELSAAGVDVEAWAAGAHAPGSDDGGPRKRQRTAAAPLAGVRPLSAASGGAKGGVPPGDGGGGGP